VSSKDIARHFQKKHAHVLRDIDRIRSMVPKNFYESNFGSTEESVVVPASGGIRQDKAYRLTRDAFSLLAMGFTGKEAIAWKLRYIEAFNALEAAALEAARALALEEGKKLALDGGVLSAARAEAAGEALTLSEKDRALLRKVIAYRRRGLFNSEIAKILDLHEMSVGMAVARARRLGFLPPSSRAGNKNLAEHRRQAAKKGAARAAERGV
jgi:Rha family phage regulatory protein